MNKTMALAACAALTLGVAACGDDDDDDDAATVTAPEVAGTAGAGPAPGTADPADAGTQPSASLTGDDADVLADCQALGSLFTATVDEPAVGEEITDEYRAELESMKESLEELDLNTDDAESVRDALIDLVDEVVASETMPEDLLAGDERTEELDAFGQRCAEVGAGG